MTERQISVSVLKPDYTGIIGTISPINLLSASCTWQWWGVGTATLVAREEGPEVAQLLKIRDIPVNITMKAPGYPRWDGSVVNVQRQKTGKNVGRITATVVDQRKWLDRILAAPVPGSPWSNQTASMHDRRTGPIATVVRQYVSANVARLAAAGQPVPIVVAAPPGTDTSPVVTIEARNETIRDEVQTTLQAHGYDVRAYLWLPGDPQPPGLSLTSVRVVVDVVAGRDKRYVNFTEDRGGISEQSLSITAPGATSIAVGGPGEGIERVFNYVVANDGRLDTLGDWGRSEVFLEASDADDVDVRIARAHEKLAELSGKVGMSLSLDDRRPWQAGPDADYWVGDTVRGTFGGIQATDRIDRISLTSNVEGFKVSPQFGDSSVTESSDIQLARIVRQLSKEIASLKAKR